MGLRVDFDRLRQDVEVTRVRICECLTHCGECAAPDPAWCRLKVHVLSEAEKILEQKALRKAS